MPGSALATLLFGVALLGLSFILLAMHWNAWRAEDHGGLAERERNFLQRRFRRRTYTSGSIGLVGLLLMAGLWLPEESIVTFFYTCGILFLVMLIVLLALSDMLASRMYFDRQEALQAAQIAALQAALKRELANQEAQRPDKPNEDKMNPTKNNFPI